jgi:hypothetical protein
MKKLLLALLLIPLVAYSADKFLHYKFNDKVVITISNIPCPIKDLKDNYPNAVVASRIDGQHLFGCYTHHEDNIVIQWANGGDKTELPANVFLIGQPSEELKPNT